MYPSDSSNSAGKIRLLYEAYPFAYCFQCGGGFASNGNIDILDIEWPNDWHGRTPIMLFSEYE